MSIIMDTHLHSTASDGIWTPAEVVRNASDLGMQVIALTDHNTSYGMEEALLESKNHPIKILPGIEFHAKELFDDNIVVTDLGIVGVGIDLCKMRKFEGEIMIKWELSLQKMVDLYNDYLKSDCFQESNKKNKFPVRKDVPISLKAIKEIELQNKKDKNYPPRVSKSQIQRYIYNNCLQNKEDLEELIGNFRSGVIEFRTEYKFIFNEKIDELTYKYCIEIIKESGGLSFFAHPGMSKGYRGGMKKGWEENRENWLKNKEGFSSYNMVEKLVGYGLDGIELYNYSQNYFNESDKDDAELINEYFEELARNFNLLVTYGSDCHGPRPDIDVCMGKFGLTEIPAWANKL